jgi:hypothetical protein
MVPISVQTDAYLIASQFGAMAADQIPFASAQALTTLAFDAQRVEKSELARSLTLRNKFSQGGIQVNRAEKNDWPNQSAEVGIEEKRSYLIDHVTGGTRQGGSHGRAILADESMRNGRGRVPKALRPRAQLKWANKNPKGGRPKGAKTGQHSTPLPFLLHSSKWGNEVLAKRMGAERYPLLIIYAFKKGVSIKPEFDMVGIAERSVQGGYYAAYTKALKRAIASGKSKGDRKSSTSRDQRIDTGR